MTDALDEVLEGELSHDLDRKPRGFFLEFELFLDYTRTKLQPESDSPISLQQSCAHVNAI